MAALVFLAAFGLIAYGVFALVRRSNRLRKQQADAWRQTAAALGLGFERGPHSDRKVHARHSMPQMFGQYDGQDVYIGVRTYTTGSGKNQTTHYRTFVHVVFDPPLARGVQVGRADGVSKFFGDVFGQADIQVGDPTFDRDFRVKGFAAPQITGLLADPSLRALLAADYGAFAVTVDDEAVRFEAVNTRTDVGQLAPLLEPAVTVYRKLLAAWNALPPSAEEARVAPAWQGTADRCKLAYRPRGMVAYGDFGSVHVTGRNTVTAKGWFTRIEIAFDPPLGTGLKLTREGALASVGKVFGAQDLQLGDAAFDPLFVVKAKDVDKARTVLVPDARARLVSLREIADDVEVSDDRIVVELPRLVDDPVVLTRLVTDARDAAEAMIRFRRPAPQAPFR